MIAGRSSSPPGDTQQCDHQKALQHLALAEALEPELWGPNIVRGMDRLEREHGNLRSALRWSIDHNEAAIALRLGASLWRFWEVRGHLAEGLAWLDEALALDVAVPIEIRARALEAAGHMARSLGRYDRATVFYAGGLHARLKLSDKRGIALALSNLGVVAQLGGNQDRCVVHHNASFELFRELGDPSGIALSLVTLGTMAQLQGRTDSARTLYQESLAIFRAVSDTRGIAASLNNLANIVSESGDYEAAKTLYNEALTHFRELGDNAEQAACLKNLALVELSGGSLENAAALCEESLNLFDELADGRGVVACLDILAPLACAGHHYELTARVVGAAQGLRNALAASSDQSSAPSPPVQHQQSIAVTREALGPERFTEECATGRALPLAEVIAEAIAVLQSHSSAEPETDTQQTGGQDRG